MRAKKFTAVNLVVKMRLSVKKKHLHGQWYEERCDAFEEPEVKEFDDVEQHSENALKHYLFYCVFVFCLFFEQIKVET